MNDTAQAILHTLGQYGQLLLAGALIMLGGMIAIILLYRLVSSLITPESTYRRLLRVSFGTLYVLILLATIIVAAEHLGYDASRFTGLAILVVLVLAVIVYFLVPFLPRLPFVPGDTIAVRGVTGVVEAVTAYQTVIRSFDGQTVFLPSALVLASEITNFSANPTRRVVLNIALRPDSDLAAADTLLREQMSAQAAVLADPAPGVFVTSVDGESAKLMAACWVQNSDWFGTQDILWKAVVAAIGAAPGVALALPRLELEPIREISRPSAT